MLYLPNWPPSDYHDCIKNRGICRLCTLITAIMNTTANQLHPKGLNPGTRTRLPPSPSIPTASLQLGLIRHANRPEKNPKSHPSLTPAAQPPCRNTWFAPSSDAAPSRALACVFLTSASNGRMVYSSTARSNHLCYCSSVKGCKVESDG
jgi:hypothetical protein